MDQNSHQMQCLLQVMSLQNIPQQDGIDYLQEALEERAQKDIPSYFIIKLIEQAQTSNIFLI